MGLMRTVTADHTGERIPEHLLDIIVNVLKSYDYGSSMGLSDISMGVKSIENNDGSGNVIPINEINFLQTKRVPIDELQLYMTEASNSRQRNTVGRRKQNVIVVASLIDRIANIAGIARTCEIFAVEMLTISSMQITNTDEFKGVAVSCDGWLPIEEVSENNLLDFIQKCRSKGYKIVGLEQTDSSINLSKHEEASQIPNKCVLILGKEKEGIPVQFLNQLDTCIEIPQFGVTRSLNVHVSAALALWEITKNNIDILTCENPIEF